MTGLSYTLDFVFCIDATGSMESIISRIRENSLKLHEDVRLLMEEKGKTVSELRVKIIVFRDLYFEGDQAFSVSPFYKLPENSDKLYGFLSNIAAFGGGDEPESGLEALALAIKSDWNKSTISHKRRQIIALWTDASAHELKKHQENTALFVKDMPESFDELTDLWEGITLDGAAKRLVLYAPDVYPWSEIANSWSNCVCFASHAGEGLAEIDYETILSALVMSI